MDDSDRRTSKGMDSRQQGGLYKIAAADPSVTKVGDEATRSHDCGGRAHRKCGCADWTIR